jgi:hypothetical protein
MKVHAPAQDSLFITQPEGELLMYRILSGVAVLSVALISGCGGSDGTHTTGPVSEKRPVAEASTGTGAGPKTVELSDNPEVKRENEIADCMKKEGFTYIPHPFASAGEDNPQSRYVNPTSLLQPDAEVRKWRQKYGFGTVASELYPNDPQVARPKQSADPNEAIVAELDPARRKAYNKALFGSPTEGGLENKTGGASSKTNKNAERDYLASCYGRHFESRTEVKTDPNTDHHRLVVKFKNDPTVEAATDKFGSCIKDRGYTIKHLSSSPYSLAGAVHLSFVKQFSSKAQAGSKPTRGDLSAEVKASLDDLDCRATYADLVRSKYPTILDAFNDEEGSG